MGPRLRDQVCVITGASSGIGRAIARAFAEEGAKIALIARGKEGLDAAAKEITERGGEAMVLPLDVSDASAVDHAANEVVRATSTVPCLEIAGRMVLSTRSRALAATMAS